MNAPRSVQVRTDEQGRPAGVQLASVWHEVLEVLDHYRTDDRWWTAEPIARSYYDLLLDDGRTLTVFRDELRTGWWEQKYG